MHGLCIRDTPYSYKNPPILNANNAIGGDKKNKKMFSDKIKSDCILWYAETKSTTSVQRLFRKKYGKNSRTPQRRDIKMWQKIFQENSMVTPKKMRPQKVDRQPILQQIEKEPKQSLRRVGNELGVSYSTVRRCLKEGGFRCYRPQIVQALKETDKVARVNFAQLILNTNSSSPNFMERIMFSDEAIFHLEGGVNTHNCSHWSKTNPAWLIEKSLNSQKVMVWAAIGVPGIIGPVFIDGSVNGEEYLRLLEEDFYPAFCNLPNASELHFMQDGAPPHWSHQVRDWLNENLADRWIGRGGPRDSNIPWPPRSPDLTPMDFYLWGHIKSKVYVRNYRNLGELKSSISAAFEEVSAEHVSGSVRSFEKRLKMVIERCGEHVEQ